MKDILIVDDQPINLRLLTEMLVASGYSVRAALSGTLALHAIQAKLPDLILLDITMPDIDGYEVCTKLKTSESTQDIPIIFLSALDEVVDKVRAFALGAADYISKPYRSEEVLHRVKNHLNLSETQKMLEEKNVQLEAAMEQLKVSQEQNLQTEKMLSSGSGGLSEETAFEISSAIHSIAENQCTMQDHLQLLRTVIENNCALHSYLAEQTAEKNDWERCQALLDEVKGMEAEIKPDLILIEASKIQADNQAGITRIQQIISGLSGTEDA